MRREPHRPCRIGGGCFLMVGAVQACTRSSRLAAFRSSTEDGQSVRKSTSTSLGRLGSYHMKIVVVGGTGLIGSKLMALLRQRDQEVLAASPDSGVNTLTGEGLAEALVGAQVVVDLT